MRSKTLYLIVLTFIFLISGNFKAWALNVENIRFGENENAIRMVLELSESTDFRVFTLPGPYRLVIDLPHFEWTSSPLSKPKGLDVKGIRHGTLQPGISRIVVDMDNPAAVQKAFLLPAQQGFPNRLVIDYSHVPVGIFNDYKGKIHGTLDTDNPPVTYHASTPSAIDTSVPAPAVKPRVVKPLIVLDPGHGGQDPGAVNGRYLEKNIVLALAKELKTQLEATGKYSVKMTRTSDVFIRLSNRVKFARHHNADLFVSIHADSIEKSGVRGASIYTLSEKSSDAQTAKLAARENRVDLIAGIDLSTEDEEVANILVDLAMRDTMNQSKFFANTLVNKFQQGGVRILEHPHRYAGFAVLKAPDIPSILVEAGFISNRQEARLLSDHDYRRKIARALTAGIDAYFERVALHERS